MVVQHGLGIHDIIGNKRDQILQLASHYGAYNVRIFGSVARGEAQPDSDVDFLVQFRPESTIWDMVGLWQALGELLHREVDLSTDDTLKPAIKLHALKDATKL
ncbi:MAG: nucleotidyltransferase family protein [Anaerolineae bacterium]|nr:nucleotidyltransferase family protein [Anaerolineae bacterium]